MVMTDLILALTQRTNSQKNHISSSYMKIQSVTAMDVKIDCIKIQGSEQVTDASQIRLLSRKEELQECREVKAAKCRKPVEGQQCERKRNCKKMVKIIKAKRSKKW